MSDEKPAGNGQAAATSQQQFEIQKIYLKDVSLENPNAPQIFAGEWKPEVNLQLNSSAHPLREDVYEVLLTVTVTARQGGRTAYLVEIKQAGVFTLKGFPAEQMGGLLNAYCPNVLYPFAREAVASLVTKGGYPPLLLNPVNFDLLYLQRLQAQKKTAQAQQAGGQ